MYVFADGLWTVLMSETRPERNASAYVNMISHAEPEPETGQKHAEQFPNRQYIRTYSPLVSWTAAKQTEKRQT